MYCIFCGTKNPDKAKFCVACGQNLAKALQETKPPVKPAASESTVLGITREEAKNQAMSAQIQGFFNGNSAVKSLPKTTTGTGRGDALSRWETVKARKDLPASQVSDTDTAGANCAASELNLAPAPATEGKSAETAVHISEPKPGNEERPVIESCTEAPKPREQSFPQQEAPKGEPADGTPQNAPAPSASATLDAPAAAFSGDRQPRGPESADNMARQEPETVDDNTEKSYSDKKARESLGTFGVMENRESENGQTSHDAPEKAETPSVPVNETAHSILVPPKTSRLAGKAKSLFEQLKKKIGEQKPTTDAQNQQTVEIGIGSLDTDYEADFADVPTGRVKMVKRGKESVREIRRNILILIAISIPLIVGSIFLIMK